VGTTSITSSIHRLKSIVILSFYAALDEQRCLLTTVLDYTADRQISKEWRETFFASSLLLTTKNACKRKN